MVSRRAPDLTQPPQSGNAAPRWRLVDRLIAGYGIVVAMVALTRIHQPGVAGVLVAHLGVVLLAWLVVHVPSTPTSRVLRGIYPIILVIGLYSAIDILNGFGAATTWDHQLQSVEQSLFGMQPSRDWWRAHPSAFWSTLLHGTYLMYYLALPTPVIVFLLRRRNDLVERYLDGVLATLITCYLFYLVIPVSGPYYQFARPSGQFVANLPARTVYAVLSSGSAFGAAFPSSHVAAMVAATIGAWRGSRRLGILLAVPTAFLVVGVVYCQMHYVLDSAAGLALGIVVASLATKERRRE